MAEMTKKIRSMTVVTLACLACVFIGFLMGLSMGRPQVASKPVQDSQQHVIRVAAMVDAAAFETVVQPYMEIPEVQHREIQGMPLRMLKIKLLKLFTIEADKHDAALVEKEMLNVSEAVFSDFTDVPADVTDRLKVELLPLLDFVSDAGSWDPDLNCAFGITQDGGRTISAIVMVLSHSNLQIVRFVGQMDPAIMDMLSGMSR